MSAERIYRKNTCIVVVTATAMDARQEKMAPSTRYLTINRHHEPSPFGIVPSRDETNIQSMLSVDIMWNEE